MKSSGENLLLCFIATTMVLYAAGCSSRKTAEQPYPYHEPLSSPGQKLSGLPPAVQATIRAQVGGADIHDIQKMGVGDQTAYEITFRAHQLFPPLYVRSDGSVLYPDLQQIAVGAGNDDIGAISGGAASGLRLSDLPQKVVSTIQEKAPTAEIAFITQTNFNGQMHFEISFQDPVRHPKIIVGDDGTFFKKVW
jgi:hypothetical protein